MRFPRWVLPVLAIVTAVTVFDLARSAFWDATRESPGEAALANVQTIGKDAHDAAFALVNGGVIDSDDVRNRCVALKGVVGVAANKNVKERELSLYRDGANECIIALATDDKDRMKEAIDTLARAQEVR